MRVAFFDLEPWQVTYLQEGLVQLGTRERRRSAFQHRTTDPGAMPSLRHGRGYRRIRVDEAGCRAARSVA
jgi:hypothetical protein